MDYNRELKKYDPLIRAIARRFAQDLIDKDTQGFDHVMSMAREAAWRALKSFDRVQGTKLSSYIGICVRRQFSVLRREQRRKKNLRLVPFIDNLPDLNDHFQFFESHTDMQKVLSVREHRAVIMTLDNNLFQKKIGKPVMRKNLNAGSLNRCLTRAKQKLSSNDLTLPCRTSRSQ